MQKKISIVIPCYYSEKMIQVVVENIKEVFDEMQSFFYEIILVNDFSKDGTSLMIEQLAQSDENIIAIKLKFPSAILKFSLLLFLKKHLICIITNILLWCR